MHTQPMSDNEGKFSEWQTCRDRRCSNCKSAKVRYRRWESFCGGYTDYQYCCLKCGHTWWIEGADA